MNVKTTQQSLKRNTTIDLVSVTLFLF
jgi:hypothetical protein